jgi:hypothetical protein
MKSDATVQWLLDGDPSIRWQALRDLAGGSDRAVKRERADVAREGWGARLLARQDANGRWAARLSADGGLYYPKWISTTYTMMLLRDFGLPPANAQTRKASRVLLDEGLQRHGGIGYGAWDSGSGRGETCVTGMVLSILAYFQLDDARLDAVAAHLLNEQMPDGGWNCRRRSGATHSSLNTTISVLEALRFFELHRAYKRAAIRRAQAGGREFLLAHRLFRSHRTGSVIKSEFTRFVFPPRWHYDVLRALDYFQAVEAPRDPRLGDAIDIVRSRQGDDGRWSLEYAYRGRRYFELERIGAPSRWNTLRALRVLKWWQSTTSVQPPG